MAIEIEGHVVETDEQGFLVHGEDWSEAFAEATAARDGVTLYDESWGLIGYFRDHYDQTSTHPSMHQLVLTLGQLHGRHFHDRKAYERFLYRLFPRDPVRELCKLAGLPRPEPDT